jgi:hypothetical protein
MKAIRRHPSACTILALAGVALFGSATAEDASPAPSWADSLEVSGDLRLRYEMIREDQSEDRDRPRFRGRIKLSADLAPDIRAVFGLATGGDDPVSNNQTIGDGFTTKDIGVNLAYLEWSVNENWMLSGGKMPQPWFRAGGTALLWDSDLNPEGLALNFEHNRLFGSAGSFLIAERSSASESRLNTIQAGVNLPVTADSALTVAVGYFDYTNTIGQAPFYDNDAQGNTIDANGNYVFDYSEFEVGVQYKTSAANLPLTLFGDYVVNTDVSREDTGYTLGFTAGDGKRPGTVQFSYAWQDTGADAINATYNDSDFANGMTDASGHYIKARYGVRDNIYLGGTLIISEYGGFTGNPRDYDRLMLDVQVSF